MECAELTAMRREATAAFKDLTLRRRRAREHAAANAGDAGSGPRLPRWGDFDAYLRRRLARSAARIESHLAVHGCQN